MKISHVWIYRENNCDVFDVVIQLSTNSTHLPDAAIKTRSVGGGILSIVADDVGETSQQLTIVWKDARFANQTDYGIYHLRTRCPFLPGQILQLS